MEPKRTNRNEAAYHGVTPPCMDTPHSAQYLNFICSSNNIYHLNLPICSCFCVYQQKGFGNIDGEYWLGLDNIYKLSNQDNYKLMIELEDWSEKKVYAEYSSFRLEPESDYYRLRLGTYQGNAGDSMMWHNGKQFTTLDRDKDMYTGKQTNKAVQSTSSVH